jgi:hypothetical protein
LFFVLVFLAALFSSVLKKNGKKWSYGMEKILLGEGVKSMLLSILFLKQRAAHNMLPYQLTLLDLQMGMSIQASSPSSLHWSSTLVEAEFWILIARAKVGLLPIINTNRQCRSP